MKIRWSSFLISQTNAYKVIDAIRIFLRIINNVNIDKTYNSEIKTESKRGIKNIVK